MGTQTVLRISAILNKGPQFTMAHCADIQKDMKYKEMEGEMFNHIDATQYQPLAFGF